MITRQAIFQNVHANPSLLESQIVERNLLPDESPVEAIQIQLYQENQNDFEIFEKLKSIKKNCLSPNPDDRHSTKEGKINSYTLKA